MRILSPTRGEGDIAEYTTDAVDRVGPNGCVAEFAFDGDHNGPDMGANVVGRLNPVRVLVAFKMPDGAVGLDMVPESNLSKGVKLD